MPEKYQNKPQAVYHFRPCIASVDYILYRPPAKIFEAKMILVRLCNKQANGICFAKKM